MGRFWPRLDLAAMCAISCDLVFEKELEMALRVPPIRQSSKHLPFGDQQNSPFYGRDILSVKQFDRSDLEYIFGVAAEMQEMVRRVGSFDLLKGKILASVFYEPSTRTSSSFTSAMERQIGRAHV